jgi:hypothetical protein
MADRFSFGKNWSNYLSVLNEERILFSTEDLRKVVGELRGKTFLDVGCGSGIHSLAAARLGASRIHSFDYDQDSVNCTHELKRRFAPDANWTIEQGSALDESYIRSLGQFDVVYSWGVLHHSGDMWKALDLVTIPVVDKLLVAIYNDQGIQSKFWHILKHAYVAHPVLRPALALVTLGLTWGPKCIIRPHRVIGEWKNYSGSRGMSAWHDVVDWAGGYPFEVATPEQLVSFYNKRGFTLASSKTVGRKLGCNEFVFTHS